MLRLPSIEQRQPDAAGASLETGGLDCGAAIMTGRWLVVMPLLLSLQIAGPSTGAEETVAPVANYSVAQDVEIDLTIDFDALRYENSDPMADNPPEDLTPGWVRHPRVDWSQRAGRSWELDPVLLHRRQAGQPDRPSDDLSNKALGIELRRRF